MTLASRLADLVAAVGADIKQLRTDVDAATFSRGADLYFFTGGAINNNASVDISVDTYPAFTAFKVGADKAGRLRVYATAAQRAADAARAIGTDPVGNHGLLLEIVSTGLVTYRLSPAVDFVPEDPNTKTLYASIQNLSGAAAALTFTLHYVRNT